MKVKHYGVIELGRDVKVSDPCYSVDTWCNHDLHNVKPGMWDCYIVLDDETELVAYLVLCKDGYGFQIPTFCEPADIGVDSGTCGIYDYEYFAKYHQPNNRDEEWYEENVMSWCMKDQAFLCTEGKGFVSDTGHGDGSYYLLTEQDCQDDEIVAIAIDYCVNSDLSNLEFIER